MSRPAVAKLACMAILAALATGSPLPARANITKLDSTAAPIVRISIRRGNVTIHTWDRSTVRVDGDPSLVVERHVTQQDGGERSLLIPEAHIKNARGLLVLPAETFVSASLPAGQRDLISVHTVSNANVGAVTITIPADSVFLFAHISKGDLVVHDYRYGTFVGFAARGRLSLVNGGGTAFLQTGFGSLAVIQSSFDRLRVRSLLGSIVFGRCAVRQIEATSIEGSIVYDDGIFEAGLARFESTYGDVAIGSTSAVQLGGRTMTSGRVYTSFADDTPVESRSGQTDAIIKGGGPVVTATSEMGNIFLYDGTLRNRPQMSAPWTGPTMTLEHVAMRRRIGSI